MPSVGAVHLPGCAHFDRSSRRPKVASEGTNLDDRQLVGRVGRRSKRLAFPWKETAIRCSELVLAIETSIFPALHEVLEETLDACFAANRQVIRSALLAG
jgi:hypothetical protein